MAAEEIEWAKDAYNYHTNYEDYKRADAEVKQWLQTYGSLREYWGIHKGVYEYFVDKKWAELQPFVPSAYERAWDVVKGGGEPETQRDFLLIVEKHVARGFTGGGSLGGWGAFSGGF